MLPFCLHSRKPVEHTGMSVELCFVKLISYTCSDYVSGGELTFESKWWFLVAI